MLLSVLLHHLVITKGDFVDVDKDMAYVGDCIEEIAKSNFVPKSSLLTVLKTRLVNDTALKIQDDVIKRFNLLLRWKIKVVDNENEVFFEDCFANMTDKCIEQALIIPEYKTKHLLLIVENTNGLSTALENYKQIKTFNIHANVLIYYANKKESTKTIPEIFEILWSHRFYKSIVVTTHNDLLRIYGFDINFKSKMCASEYRIKVPETYSRNTTLEGKNLFRIDIPKVFDCNLNVITSNVTPYVMNTESGIEIFLIKDIADHLGVRLNITMDKTPGHWGIKISNTVWGGRFGIVQNNSMIGIGVIPTNLQLYEEFFLSTGYLQECMIWVSPRAQLVPEWEILYRVFLPLLTIVCVFVLTIGTFSLNLTSSFNNELETFISLTRNWFNSFQIMIGSVVCNQPKSRYTRLVFMSLALGNIVLATLYQGSLTKLLQHPLKQHQIKDQDEILQYGLDIAGPTVFQYVFYTNPQIFDIYKTRKGLETLDAWLDRAAKYRNFATPSIGFYVRYRLAQNDPILLDSNGEPKVTILKDPIFCYRHHFVTPRGFLLAESFNRLVNKYSTYGFMFKWEKYYYKEMEKSRALRTLGVHDSKLKLKHLRGAFLALATGYVFGLFALIFEIIFSWKSKATGRTKRKTPKYT